MTTPQQSQADEFYEYRAEEFGRTYYLESATNTVHGFRSDHDGQYYRYVPADELHEGYGVCAAADRTTYLFDSFPNQPKAWDLQGNEIATTPPYSAQEIQEMAAEETAQAASTPLPTEARSRDRSAGRAQAMNEIYGRLNVGERGVFVAPVLYVNGQHVEFPEGSRVFKSGQPSPGRVDDGDSYANIEVAGLNVEMGASQRDAEVAALDTVRNYLGTQQLGKETAGIRVDLVSNVGPCDGCKCRMQKFSEDVSLEFPGAQITVASIYSKGNQGPYLDTQRRGQDTTYGYPIGADALKSSSGNFQYYRWEGQPRPMQEWMNDASLQAAAGITQERPRSPQGLGTPPSDNSSRSQGSSPERTSSPTDGTTMTVTQAAQMRSPGNTSHGGNAHTGTLPPQAQGPVSNNHRQAGARR
ncbi:hypothetical protein [Streptomyces olivochromogenes]|uniref:hypothetical protein n=1 Tax=Streptomyces olivochromogenes TaxID=1963 RepID=UPI001F42B931|nr:hypothetical protein [Streptomyces olivochromogenes]MCF3132473.1 hypothetical protein [Streptomyces olivochromogenes]